MKKTGIIGSLVLAMAIAVLPTSNVFAIGTDAGTTINAGGDSGAGATYGSPIDAAGDGVLTYNSGTGNFLQTSSAAAGENVEAVYGWGLPTASTDVTTGAPGTVTDFNYTIYNRSNTSDTANFALGGLSYAGGASNWNQDVTTTGNSPIVDSGVVAEDASFAFKVRITPSSNQSESPNDGQATFDLAVTSDGDATDAFYTGANGTEYAGLSSDAQKGGTFNDGSYVKIAAPVIVVTTSIAGVSGNANLAGGETGPGTEIRYQFNVTNSGNGTASNSLLSFSLPANTKLAYNGGAPEDGSTSTDGVYTSAAGASFEAHSGGWAAYSIGSQGAANAVTAVRVNLTSLGTSANENVFVRVDVQ